MHKNPSDPDVYRNTLQHQGVIQNGREDIRTQKKGVNFYINSLILFIEKTDKDAYAPPLTLFNLTVFINRFLSSNIFTIYMPVLISEISCSALL